MVERDARIAIAGAGLAGLALADELLEQGLSARELVIFDRDDPARGSDNPGAIFHPFPGKSIAPGARKLAEATASVRTIRRWNDRWPEGPIRSLRMIRPLGDDERSRRLLASRADSDEYPPWLEIRRVDASALGELEPRLTGWEGAFVYRPAFCVDMGRLCELLVDSLVARGADLREGARLDRLVDESSCWRCLLSEGAVTVRRVVLALGRTTGAWFPNLAMRCRGGELLIVDDAPKIASAIHGGGHVAPRPGGGVVAGATWWPPEALEDRSDARAEREIASVCRDLVADLAGRSGRIWRGIRTGFGDYQPLVGPIPGFERLHAMTAFGGTGLLSIPRHARTLAAHLLGSPGRIPELSRPDRMGADKWRPAPDHLAEP